MLQIKERTVDKPTTANCGHTVAKGQSAYTLTFLVCEQEAACMYLTVKAIFQALATEKAHAWKPPFAYRLWHATIGKLMRKKITA
jgi:hypothetical protein